VIDCNVRFNLVRGHNMKVEDEPTARMRGIRVYEELQRRGWDADMWDGSSNADVIVVQYEAPVVQQAAPHCDYVIWDCNDAVFLPHHQYAPKFDDAVRVAAWVTTGSTRIAEHIKARTGGSPCVSYIPEAIDSMYDNVARAPSENVSILWTGMHDNLMYLDVIDPVLAALSAEYDFEVVLVSSELTSQGKSNATTVAEKPYPGRHVTWSPATIVEEMGTASIAVCPLFQCEWCWCKSVNKAGMFAGVGIPTVASDVPSYRELIEHGVGGYLAFTPDDWYKPLSALIESRGLRDKIGAAGQKTARELYSTAVVVDEWERVLRRVLG